MEFTTVSARIPREIKKILTENDIEISKIIQDALAAEAKRIETAKLADALERAGTILSKIDPKLITQLIREDRDSR